MFPEDTIVALSSATGPGARAIVRLSGAMARRIVAGICPDFVPLPGHFFSGPLRLRGFHSPLPADLYFFAAPHTYTGQELVEIHTIASPPILDVLIAECLAAGARAAQPGEFTMRAFLAGKLDLTRAEAVLGVIEASDRHELQQALIQLAGGITEPMRALRDDLLNLLADVEAGLDFTDEDIRFVAADDLLRRIGAGLAHLALLARQLDQRAHRQRPFRVVLAGKPNAGKSSLFNALVGANAALVSPEPGTTRDYLEQTIALDGVTLDLVDSAGAAEARDEIDASAQALGERQARTADLVVWCQACDSPANPIAANVATPARVLSIATKTDLAAAPEGMLATSVATGVGLAELRQRLAQAVRQAGHATMAPSLSRCRHHVEACLQCLQRAHATVIDEGPHELLALDLRLALDELGAMAGAVYTNDLLDRIFSRFCIGK